MPIRKHQGIVQTGGKKGKLKKGYKYSGKKLKSGLPQIVKVKKSKNKTYKKGGKALATGSYGCIFRPVIERCDPSKDYNGKVSKLALNAATDGCPELNMGLLLNSYDKEFKHFLAVTEMCKVNPSKKVITIEDKGECPNLIIDNKLHDNLIMPSARIGLDKIFQPESKYNFGISADIIGKIIMKTCESCKILRDNGIAHFDLKNQNMMFKWTDTNPDQPKMESFLIDFGKEFMPTSWTDFDDNFIDYWNPMSYVWAPEIWLQFADRGNYDPDITAITEDLNDFDNTNSWYSRYITNLRDQGTTGWKKFIDKAMVYQIINGIFYWASSPDFYWYARRDIEFYYVPHLHDKKNGIRFNSKIEAILKANPGLKKLFTEMLTINPNNRPTLEQVQNKLEELHFVKNEWEFEPNPEANW